MTVVAAALAEAKRVQLAASLAEAKRALRRALRATPPLDAAAQSEAIAVRVAALPLFAGARALAVYIAMPGGREADPGGLLAAAAARGARVYAPAVLGPAPHEMVMRRIASAGAVAGFRAGAFGIPEPPPSLQEAAAAAAGVADGGGAGDALEDDEMGCVVVPGAGFDAGCRRIGHGRGYYDAFLARAAAAAAARGRPPPFTVGLCLREQLVEEVPVGADDVLLDAVVTPDATYFRWRDS